MNRLERMLALAQAKDDFAHPAFGKLFIETEFLPERGALICHRRPRDSRGPEQDRHVSRRRRR